MSKEDQKERSQDEGTRMMIIVGLLSREHISIKDLIKIGHIINSFSIYNILYKHLSTFTESCQRLEERILPELMRKFPHMSELLNISALIVKLLDIIKTFVETMKVIDEDSRESRLSEMDWLDLNESIKNKIRQMGTLENVIQKNILFDFTEDIYPSNGDSSQDEDSSDGDSSQDEDSSDGDSSSQKSNSSRNSSDDDGGLWDFDDSDTWVCYECTFDGNDMNSSYCQMCGAEKHDVASDQGKRKKRKSKRKQTKQMYGKRKSGKNKRMYGKRKSGKNKRMYGKRKSGKNKRINGKRKSGKKFA